MLHGGANVWRFAGLTGVTHTFGLARNAAGTPLRYALLRMIMFKACFKGGTMRLAAFAAFLTVLPYIAFAEPLKPVPGIVRPVTKIEVPPIPTPSPAPPNGTVTITTAAVNYNGTYSPATPTPAPTTVNVKTPTVTYSGTNP
jgi:hypothetical protein